MPRPKGRIERFFDRPGVFLTSLAIWAAIVAYVFWKFDPGTAAHWAQAF